uniref:Uncharacterized protein n=1 Tax=Ornithorhynchus anatinus TaxID=9258 RepID=A0A6I8N2K7_ORNAN
MVPSCPISWASIPAWCSPAVLELMGFPDSSLPSYLISLLLLLLFQLLPQTSAQFTVIGPAQPIVVQVGEVAELPCHLTPKMNAGNMEVRWLRATFSPAVFVYRDGRGQFEEQMEEYRERTELLNDFITDGRMTVLLHDVRVSDNGSYHCRFQNSQHVAKSTLDLVVAASFFRTVSPSTVALAVILPVLVLLMAGAVCLLWKRHRKKKKKKKKRENTWNELLSSNYSWRRSQSCMVDITLDPDTAHPKLILSEDQKSVNLGGTQQNLLPDNAERFDEEPWVLGHEGFNSGRHWWEVEVGKKRGWGLGICRENVKRKGSISVSPEEGFWVVGLCGGEYSAFTNPKTTLPLPNQPHRVVVHLDYEAGVISFYSGTDRSHIYTFSHLVFSGTLRPFFHPQTEDQISLTIYPVSGGAERDPAFAPKPAPSQDALVTHQGAEPASDTEEGDPSPGPDAPLLGPQPSPTVPPAP